MAPGGQNDTKKVARRLQNAAKRTAGRNKTRATLHCRVDPQGPRGIVGRTRGTLQPGACRGSAGHLLPAGYLLRRYTVVKDRNSYLSHKVRAAGSRASLFRIRTLRLAAGLGGRCYLQTARELEGDLQGISRGCARGFEGGLESKCRSPARDLQGSAGELQGACKKPAGSRLQESSVPCKAPAGELQGNCQTTARGT